MDLKFFLVKYQINLEPAVLSSCQDALERMSYSRDVLHDQNHILRIFDLLDQFLSADGVPKKNQIDFNVLLLAITWHDVWKARLPNLGFLGMFFKLYWDGPGSAGIFALKNRDKLPKEIFRSALYCIRRHSPPRPLFIKSTELKILRDLDGLEEWSPERLDGLVRQLLDHRSTNFKLIRWFKLYFDLILKKQKSKKYYYAWSREEFANRKLIYISKVENLLKENPNF